MTLDAILMTGLWNARPRRRPELFEALRANLVNPHISRVSIFLEDEVVRLPADIADHAGIEILRPHFRCRFVDFFNHADGFPGRIVIVSNADIAFDDSLGRLAELDWDNLFAAICRNRNAEGFNDADSWVFRAPLPVFACDWELGRLGCTTKLIHSVHRAGMRIINPGLDVMARHVHASDIRSASWRDMLPLPRMEVPPHHIGQVARVKALR